MFSAAYLNMHGGPLRFCSVNGFDGRTNDMLYSPPLQKPNADEENTAVVYFGGDVQDFPENMETNFESKAYLKYNLESTALQLRNGFPKSHVIVIRPARVEFNTFSCFDNFVRSNSAGVPDHTPNNFALQHFEKLLQNLSQRIRAMDDVDMLGKLFDKFRSDESSSSSNSSNSNTNNHLDMIPSDVSAPSSMSSTTITPEITDIHTLFTEPLWWREENFDKTNLILVGFSKGCVVLNQFIYEFHYIKTLTPDDSSMMRLVSRIKDIYWLDGGHGGTKNGWITSRSLLETLTRLNINIHVHVTPYQVLDERRPWIKKEEKNFTDLLKKLGANLQRTLHFESKLADLNTHFDVIRMFRQQQQTSQAQTTQSNSTSTATTVTTTAVTTTVTSTTTTTTSTTEAGSASNLADSTSVGSVPKKPTDDTTKIIDFDKT